MHLCELNISIIIFGGVAVLHPPKSDEEMFNSQITVIQID